MSTVDSLFSKRYVLTEGETSWPIGRWPMPVKGTKGQVTINDEPVEVMKTETGDIKYTYFVFLNNSMIVKGHIADGAILTFEYPEGFARAEPPEPRKTYYKPKKVEYEQDVNEDGTPATNEDGTPRYKLDAEGNPIPKPKPVKVPKAKKEKAPKAEGEAPATEAAPAAEPEATAPPPRRRREAAPSQPTA